MKYLIDTHTFIWFNEGSDELSQLSKEIIKEANNQIFLSITSLWEISIKISIGKLAIKGTYEDLKEDIEKNNIEILPISFSHTAQQIKLPLHHRDPFDRMIVSQSIVEEMNLISRDEIFDTYLQNTTDSTYRIKRIW